MLLIIRAGLIKWEVERFMKITTVPPVSAGEPIHDLLCHQGVAETCKLYLPPNVLQFL